MPTWRTPRRPAVLPAGFIKPCSPTISKVVPVDDRWLYEFKHDGYRLIVRKDGERVRIFTRRGFDWTKRYPLIVRSVAKLKASSIVLDGEGVFCGSDGVADFDKLHSQGYDAEVRLFAFDLLHLDGEDMRSLPLEQRKKLLKKVLGRKNAIHFVEHLEGDGEAMFEHVCQMGWEGIVSKRRDLPYRSGPSKSWLKIKNPASPAMLRVKDDA